LLGQLGSWSRRSERTGVAWTASGSSCCGCWIREARSTGPFREPARSRRRGSAARLALLGRVKTPAGLRTSEAMRPAL
jgi:hypothetical protein